MEQGRGIWQKQSVEDNTRLSGTDKPVCVRGSWVFGQDPLSMVGRGREAIYVPMEKTPRNRRRERIKIKGIMEMRRVNRKICSLCHSSYLRKSEEDKAQG